MTRVLGEKNLSSNYIYEQRVNVKIIDMWMRKCKRQSNKSFMDVCVDLSITE